MMKSHAIHEARSSLSRLVDQALKGEPQRITRYGKEAVMIVSEKDWVARSSFPVETYGPQTLGALLAHHAEQGTLSNMVTDRPWLESDLGSDF
jgi:prevent-host-death family protein